MGRYRFCQIRSNLLEKIGWTYVCDAEADLANPADDMLAAIVVTPDSGKSQQRIRKSDNTFGEVTTGGGSGPSTYLVRAYSTGATLTLESNDGSGQDYTPCSGTDDGTNWQTIKIGNTTKSIAIKSATLSGTTLTLTI